jgi:hypothetical protein
MMRKIILAVLVVILLANLVVLIIALTNNSAANPFKEYRFFLGLVFIVIGGITKKFYKANFGGK